MKKFVQTIIVLMFINTLPIQAHEVNRYKYFCMDVKENPYDIEESILEEFQKMGFYIMDYEFYQTLDAKHKSLTLFAKYDYSVNYNGASRLTLTLENVAGVPIWRNTGYGCTLFSIKGDMRKATKKIVEAFSLLEYKFDESLLENAIVDHPYAKWTEDSVKNYISTQRTLPIEGIYKNYSNDGQSYKLAVLKHNDAYYGVILESDNVLWEKGEVKIIFRHIDSGLYDVEYYGYDKRKLNAIAGLENRKLEITASCNGEDLIFRFLKVYPSGSEDSSTGTVLPNQNKVSGSGVLIADNIIITNYHVVESAERIDAIIDIDGVSEAFSSQVLCSDKVNDLAIVYIKDDKFNGVDSIPFQILPNVVDVGTSVFTMGFPMSNYLGDEIKVTDGIVNSKSGYDGDITKYQISVPIHPGNSGSPLFDRDGNLVGIVNSKVYADNVGYAIKSSYVLSLIESAPINIKLPDGIDLKGMVLSELIKKLKPYVVYLKVFQ